MSLNYQWIFEAEEQLARGLRMKIVGESYGESISRAQ
jgi:hypothetical protein